MSTDSFDLRFPASAVPPVSDADYRMMVNAVIDYAIFMLDPAGHICSWNAGAQRLKGYTADEVVGRSFEMFYPQEEVDAGRPRLELDEALRHGRIEDEGWRLRKDGVRFWASTVMTALFDEGGTHRGFVKVIRDLSERRQQEEVLRQSDEVFRLMVEGVRDYAIFMLDPGGHIVSWNLGAQINKGYIAEEIIGKHFSVFYPQEKIDQRWPETELEMAQRDGRFEDEGWRVRKDGSRFWASVVITALYDETGRHRGFAKVTRDLTAHRRIDVLEGESRQLTQFLAILGHELRNPLASISNAAAIMQMETIASPRLLIVRDVLSRQVAHFKRLVDDLLDVGRIASGKVHLERAPVGLQQVVAEALEAMAPAVRERRHRLETHIAERPLWVVGDKVRLVQVLTNLLHNACKFTPEGGRLRVSLTRHANHAELSVADNGRGIAAHQLNDVFKLFAQVEDGDTPAHGGLGIGLNLVYQMVQRHGGEVSVYSTGIAGEGAEFVVRLPLMDAPPDVAGMAAE
jgi:PAS domain S-box-containing protein